MDLELLKSQPLEQEPDHDLATWFKACPLADIDETTDSNILQEAKYGTQDLRDLVANISGIGAGFTYSTIFRFSCLSNFYFQTSIFLHLAQPVVLLSSCLGHPFSSSADSSSPRLLRLFLVGWRQLDFLSDIRACGAYSRGQLNPSSQTPHRSYVIA